MVDIFLDTADLSEIRRFSKMGVIDGVTTNPSLIKKVAGVSNARQMEKYIWSIFNSVPGGDVSVEVVSTDRHGMIAEGRKIDELFRDYSDNLLIKIPGTEEGLYATRELSADRLRVNATLIFSPGQALLMAKAGAYCVSTFSGRVNDRIREQMGWGKINDPANAELGKRYHKTSWFPADGWREEGRTDGRVVYIDVPDEGVRIRSGVDLTGQTSAALLNTKTLTLAASLRNAREAVESAIEGAEILTVPPNVLDDMLGLTAHSQVVSGVEAFERDTVPEYRQMFDLTANK